MAKPKRNTRTDRATYRDIQQALGGLKTFNGNTLSAVGTVDDAQGYRVFSYQTEIARVWRDAGTDRLYVWHDREHYTKTTTRGQNLCRKFLVGIPSPTRQEAILHAF